MAQNLKAKRQQERLDLLDAVVFAQKRFEKAKESLSADPKALKNIRRMQVAKDELKNLRKELKQFSDATDPEAVRREDASPRRNHGSWPVGKPYDPNPRKKIRKTERREDTTPLPPPPAPRPAVLATRQMPTKEGSERVSWWVGVDRTTLQSGAKVLATAPPAKTSRPSTKAQVKTVQQQTNDAKRDAKRDSTSAAKKLNEILKPMSGAFSSIPMAD